jgi:hypothetical protein
MTSHSSPAIHGLTLTLTLTSGRLSSGQALSDPHIPKKVGFIKKDFHPERSAMNAYVVFKARESAEAALAANGSLLDGKHITCDIAANKVRGWLVDSLRAAILKLASAPILGLS